MTRYFACLIAFFLPLCAHAETRHYVGEYRIYAAGILFAKVDIQLDMSADDYRLSAHIAPALVGRLASNTHVVATTSGRLVNGDFEPKRLDLNWVRDGAIKSTYMDYDQGAPIKFVSSYQPEKEQLPVTPVDIATIGTGTLDPFTAMLLPIPDNNLSKTCDNNIEIFDGRRYATLQLQDPTEIPAAQHSYPARINALACKVLWNPIAGYSQAALDRAAEFPPVTTHYGRIGDTDFAAPLEMSGRSRYGKISIYAVQFFAEPQEKPVPFNIADYLPPTLGDDEFDNYDQ